MHRLIFAAALATPLPALAVGGTEDAPPPPTETTIRCETGQVWDNETKSCVSPRESRLDDDTLYRAAREFAYAGRYRDTLDVLDAMSDQMDDRVLTYRGFAHRKLGETARGMAYYQAALTANPDNLLARSYLGQAYAEAGDMVLARTELSEIRARGGRGTWAETALRLTLETGRGTAY